MHYGRFLAMIATSTVVMFALMYLNTYLIEHVFWSQTRAYMALVMGAAMLVVMLAFMLSMYRNRALNVLLVAAAVVVFGASLWLVRNQATIEDRAYMRAMIPHHSIAIMTSSRANISDPRVRKLADEIIYAQDKEIAEMRYLVADIGDRESTGEAVPPASAPATVVPLHQALSSPEIATLDPEFMAETEIAGVFPGGTACTFRYTVDSAPVLAVGENNGTPAALVKLSGDLVRLPVAGDASETAFASENLAVDLAPVDDGDIGASALEADMRLSLGNALSAGYRGYLACGI
ncbi:MAG: hypothetical protein AcusKO_08320 [Acuticoccus sp.]